MNEIKIKVKFKKGLCYSQGINLVTNDYNSTKLVFEFDDNEGTKIFELRDSDDNVILADEIVNNELILARFDEHDNAYPIFTKEGEYVYEISLYKDNSKLTSASDKFKVNAEQVIIDGEIVETYTPMFDNLLSDLAGALQETDNIDIDVNKVENTATVSITKKDGTTKSVQVFDGDKGDKGDKGEKGDTGERGPQGEQGVQGIQGPMGPQGKAFTISKTYSSISEMNADFDNMQVGDYVMIASSVELEDNAKLYVKGEEEWLFVSDFSGAMGIQGEQGIQGIQGIQGEQGIQGIQGETGNGIATIQKTSTSGLIDTYTITYTDGNTSTFSITNGEDGEVSQEQLDETNSHLDHLSKVSNLFEKITGTGTSITLNDTSDTIMKLNLDTTTSSQENVPTPSYPQTIHTITGNNEIKIRSKNLFNTSLRFADETKNGVTLKNNIDGSFTLSGTATSNFQFTASLTLEEMLSIGTRLPAGTYTQQVAGRLQLYDSNNTFIMNAYQTFTTEQETYIKGMFIEITSGTTYNRTFYYQVEEGSSATSYSPCKSQTYPINLGDIEVCKIGDYQDVLFKNTLNSEYYNSSLELNKWYLKNNIGKLVLDGNEDYDRYSSLDTANYNCFYLTRNDFFVDSTGTINTTISNYFLGQSFNDRSNNIANMWVNKFASQLYFKVPNTITTSSGLKTWLNTHNTIVYYVMASPTDILLNNTLQTQLDSIQYALAYDTQTNISQTNNDLPFIISAETYKEINLTNYVKNTDYATSNKGGVIKTGYGSNVDSNGNLYASNFSYANYQTAGNNNFISKGTLENVVAGKELDLKQLSTFDRTKTQVLKNINGTLTWVDES